MGQYPRHILHVVGGMNRAGTETWLMHLLRNIDREKYKMDFLVQTDEPCDYDDEIRELGSSIIVCPYPRQPLKYAREFRKILSQYDPYDVVHSHVHHFSGWVLRQAQIGGIPIRIAHSHNDKRIDSQQASVSRRSYLYGMKALMNRYATHKIAVSKRAAASLFGENWENDPRCQVVYLGIDLSVFSRCNPNPALRREFGIPQDSFVIGHVGRFVDQKNHTFLIDIFVEIIKKQPESYLLLVGDGPLRPDIEQKVSRLGLSGNVIFAGIRPDVPELMLNVMDIFLFPSLYEGLGIVLIEAQSSGLSCVYSDVVPEEARIVPKLVSIHSLDETSNVWADTVLRNYLREPIMPQSEALRYVEKSQFSVHKSISSISSIYDGVS